MGINRVIFDNEGKVVRIVKYLARENDENSLSSNYIWPIDKGSDSTYWIGTMGNGLNKVTLIDRPNGFMTTQPKVTDRSRSDVQRHREYRSRQVRACMVRRL